MSENIIFSTFLDSRLPSRLSILKILRKRYGDRTILCECDFLASNRNFQIFLKPCPLDLFGRFIASSHISNFVSEKCLIRLMIFHNLKSISLVDKQRDRQREHRQNKQKRSEAWLSQAKPKAFRITFRIWNPEFYF